MPLVHKFDRAKFNASRTNITTLRAEGHAAADRARAAVGQANAATSVPALRAVVAQMAGDMALITDAIKHL